MLVKLFQTFSPPTGELTSNPALFSMSLGLTLAAARAIP